MNHKNSTEFDDEKNRHSQALSVREDTQIDRARTITPFPESAAGTGTQSARRFSPVLHRYDEAELA
jgi:hypothetical protein